MKTFFVLLGLFLWGYAGYHLYSFSKEFFLAVGLGLLAKLAFDIAEEI